MLMYIYACMLGVLEQRAIEPSLGGSTRVALVVALGQIVGRKEGGGVGRALGEEVVAAMSVILMPARGEEPELTSAALQVEHRVHMYMYIYVYVYVYVYVFVMLSPTSAIRTFTFTFFTFAYLYAESHIRNPNA